MNRKEKYKTRRLNNRISIIKRSLFIFTICSFIVFSFSMASVGTYSYFNAEYVATMDVRNATKDELVKITEGELVYEEKCIAKQPVTIKNIFDYLVNVTIAGTEYALNPGESITHVQVVADNCGEFGEKTINIIGYVQYFDHEITVMVDKEKLKPKNDCPQPAIDNAQGKENDNGEGKHCGNKGNPVHDNEDADTKQDKKKSIEIPSEEKQVKEQEVDQPIKEEKQEQEVKQPITEEKQAEEEEVDQPTTEEKQPEEQKVEQPPIEEKQEKEDEVVQPTTEEKQIEVKKLEQATTEEKQEQVEQGEPFEK